MKKLIIIVGIVFVGGLAVVGYNLGSGSGSADSEGSPKNIFQGITEKLKTGGDKEENFFGSMQDLIARGKPLKCTYKSTYGTEGIASGVIYISGDKVRMEMNIIEEQTGEKVETVFIVTGGWLYSWNSFTPKGTKMNMEGMMDETGENYPQGEMDKTKEKMDYKCRPWLPNNSKFAIPTDIEFMDITEMMEGFKDIDMKEIAEDAEKAKKMICDMCEIAPTAELRAECRADAECE